MHILSQPQTQIVYVCVYVVVSISFVLGMPLSFFLVFWIFNILRAKTQHTYIKKCASNIKGGRLFTFNEESSGIDRLTLKLIIHFDCELSFRQHVFGDMAINFILLLAEPGQRCWPLENIYFILHLDRS